MDHIWIKQQRIILKPSLDFFPPLFLWMKSSSVTIQIPNFIAQLILSVILF